MKVLVTGGLGFIGSNFILKALNENKELSIINVDAEFQGSDHKNLDSIKDNEKYSFVKGNITNKNLMEKLISKVDAVVNFAAESFVDRSILDPNPFLVSNIRGTYTILELIKKEKKRLVQISTDEVYGSLETGPAVENSRFNPSSPYAATKAAAELLVNSYNTTFECDSIITRCTNNFGPRQYPEKLIPKVILLANQNKKIPIYGNGKNIRDWIFVEDHCEAVLQVLLNGKNGESYNISAKNEIDNLTIVKKILEILNKSEDLIEFVEDRPGHDIRYSLSSEKIRNELGWKGKIDFDVGIERTVKWYLSNQELFLDNKDTQQATPWK
jgi:dTDP-glucose 4,6-dehydratase